MLDLRIDGARVCDGTGNPWFHGEIGIADGRIVSLAGRRPARRVIRAAKLVAAPGFVDVHTHGDAILENPRADNLLRQGITSIISGNCGASRLPVGEMLARVAKKRPAINYGTLAGHGTLRQRALGMAARTPKARELTAMKEDMRREMAEGAFGLSTGLFYNPGAYARIDEVINLAKIASAHGGVYASHMRSAGGKMFEALDETARLGDKAAIPVQMSHLKVLHKTGRTGPGRMAEVLARIAGYRQQGVEVTFDLYPYTATCTGLTSVILPPWVSADGKKQARLRDEKVRAQIAPEVVNNIAWLGGADRIAIIGCEADPRLVGGTLAQAAERKGVRPESLAMDLLSVGDVRCIFHILRAEDVRAVICSEFSMIASDSHVIDKPRGPVHPRYYGTFPRVLREFVRERKLLRLEEAVRRMTSFPARKFGLAGRGVIAPGMAADLVIFNPETVADTATFEQPHAFPVGIEWVLVNGRVAWRRGRETIGRHGQILTPAR